MAWDGVERRADALTVQHLTDLRADIVELKDMVGRVDDRLRSVEICQGRMQASLPVKLDERLRGLEGVKAQALLLAGMVAAAASAVVAWLVSLLPRGGQ